MLVLSRKTNEAIVIGDNVTIVVVAIEGDMVRLGITVPEDMSVHRKEVVQAAHPVERPTPAGWIRIADELPAFGKPVFLYDASTDTCYLGSRERETGGWIWTTAFRLPDWAGGEWETTSTVTVILPELSHWHALPDPREAR